jgi:multidrug efflux pump subunit AcrB
MEQTRDIVDVDDRWRSMHPSWCCVSISKRPALLGVPQQSMVQAVSTVLSGEDASYLHVPTVKYPVPIRLEFPVYHKAAIDSVLALKLRNRAGRLVPLSELVEVRETVREHAIYHKDLQRVVFVTGDMAGKTRQPAVRYVRCGRRSWGAIPWRTGAVAAVLHQSATDNPYDYSLKWDGEWQVTYETFRDMGIAYSVGLILIYLLVVAQFRSYLVPLIIMAPIPLTVIGVMPGHWLFGNQFTATSMIGMIALAGIIVRNSILLVDFHQSAGA